jgi:hypothetical protein
MTRTRTSRRPSQQAVHKRSTHCAWDASSHSGFEDRPTLTGSGARTPPSCRPLPLALDDKGWTVPGDAVEAPLAAPEGREGGTTGADASVPLADAAVAAVAVEATAWGVGAGAGTEAEAAAREGVGVGAGPRVAVATPGVGAGATGAGTAGVTVTVDSLLNTNWASWNVGRRVVRGTRRMRSSSATDGHTTQRLQHSTWTQQRQQHQQPVRRG